MPEEDTTPGARRIRKEYPRAEFRLDTEKIPIYRAMIKNLCDGGFMERPTFNALAKKSLELMSDKFERNVLTSSKPAPHSLNNNKKPQQPTGQVNALVEVQGQGQSYDSLLQDSLSFSFAETSSLREELEKLHTEKLAQNRPSEFSSLIEFDRGKEEVLYVDESGYSIPMLHKMSGKDQNMSFSSLTCFQTAMAGKSGFSIETVNGTKMNIFYYPMTFRSTRLAVLSMRPVRQYWQ